MNTGQIVGIAIMTAVFIFLVIMAYCSNNYSLNGIKSKKIGNGQHGTARFATKSEIKKTYAQVPFEVDKWRKQKDLPAVQGTVI